MHKEDFTNYKWLRNYNGKGFNEIALSLYRWQYQHNPLYRDFANALDKTPATVNRVEDLPFLPVSFFKSHVVKTGQWIDEVRIFESSGTSGEQPAKHFVKDDALYEATLLNGFEDRYGTVKKYAILALLPSYLERGNASLVHMAKVLMKHSGQEDGGFYLDDITSLKRTLERLEKAKQKTILIGVTFALIDAALSHPFNLKHTIVMETGGMKGRREEWTRQQVHTLLKRQWKLEDVHAEYGMTEMMSQAYSTGGGIFTPAPTMKVLLREMQDPLSVRMSGEGLINVIDLGNVHSCAFLATDDIGSLQKDGRFQVLGRADNTALRGCSLMSA